MMEYNTFKNVLVQRIMDYLPPLYHDFKVEIKDVDIVNGKEESLMLVPPDNAGYMLPSFRLHDVYAHFCETQDMEWELKNIASFIMQGTQKVDGNTEAVDIRKNSDRIIRQLIGRDRNEDLLAGTPHREILDLALVYRFIMKADEDGFASFLITEEAMERAGMSEEDLYENAVNNTKRMLPWDEITGFGPVVVSNKLKMYGATSMLYQENMIELATRMEADIYILPTSMHEFFALSANDADPEMLRAMLHEGNRTVTEEKDVLSDSIYVFRKDTGKLEVA